MHVRAEGLRFLAAATIAACATALLATPQRAVAAPRAPMDQSGNCQPTSSSGCFSSSDTLDEFTRDSYCSGAGCQTCAQVANKMCGFQENYDRAF